MSPKKNAPDKAKYQHHQYAFRATEGEIQEVQSEVKSLYDKFNKGRDPKDPKGRRAVKNGNIALEALRIGLRELKKRSKWEFED